MAAVPADEELARAFYLVGGTMARLKGTTPGVLALRLRGAVQAAGVALNSDPSELQLRAALHAAYQAVQDQTADDPDLLLIRDQLAVALAEVRENPLAFQSLTVVGTAAGLIIVLALIGKLKVKDGKWELVEGLPGFEHLTKLFPGIFNG